jgi:ATP-binding cassette subfamily F protein uup
MGSKILVVKNLTFSWNNEYYLKEFSYTFSRFEKIGIIGENGTGKSTFLHLLIQNLKPQSGGIEIGETVRFGFYRQDGLQFDENMRVLDAVTEVAETVALSDGTRITASQFLTYFLFPHARQNDYIYKLSGGEKRRLYLCQVLMQNPNFLILDEPTNDLDIASLQVLEEYLSTFNGCVLVVSHDRYFMDSVVDHLFVFEDKAKIKDFPGNYSAYFLWKKEQEKASIKRSEHEKKTKPRTKSQSQKLSFNEKRELEQLENEIENLEEEKARLEESLSSGSLPPEELNKKSERIGQVIELLDSKSDRWLELSDRTT